MGPQEESAGTARLEHSRSEKKNRAAITRLQQELFAEGIVSRKVLDAVPSPLLIINENWQVIYANQAVLGLFGTGAGEENSGLAPGDAFHCIHTRHTPPTPGRHANCRICGIARVLSRSLKGEETSEDCRLDCDLGERTSPLLLRVWATPLEFHDERFSILSLVDISDKEHRKVLEKICFHDLLNTLTSIRGILSVMQDQQIDDLPEICRLLEQMTQGSIDEIVTLRLLEQAQQRDIEPRQAPLQTREFLDLMRKSLQAHPAAREKRLVIADNSCDHGLATDLQLLRRIVGNMLINALEATAPGHTVTLGCRPAAEGVSFWVHNRECIPPEIREKIFQRAVSSKGGSRGLGTYSIKLLSSILDGQVDFTSNEQDGTTFTLWLPPS